MTGDTEVFEMNACRSSVMVIGCDQGLVAYPDFEAVNCQVPGAPLIITYPDEPVVPEKLLPDPSVPVTRTP